MVDNNKVSEIIWKIKIFFAVINTIMWEIGLYHDGADWIILVVALIIIPLSSLIWNRTLYNGLNEEKSFNMSYYIFERVTLIFPIGLFITTVGLTLRQ